MATRAEAAATLVLPAAGEPQERRRRTGTFAPDDLVVLLGSAGSSFALVWLSLVGLGPLGSWVEFAVAWYAVFLALYWGVVRTLDGPVMAGERVMTVVLSSAALAMVAPLLLIVGYVLREGLAGLGWNTLTQTQASVGPLSPVSQGGAMHAIVGTLEQVAIAVVISVPLGFLCALFLNEVGGHLGRPVRVFVDAMSGVPTIVAGLFVYAVWVSHYSWSGFAAALAISISMLPVITRTSEEVLRLVPDGLREASLALGGSEWRTVWSVVLPTARTGLVTAIILGVARAIGETAPLIMTAFGAYVMNANPFHGPQAALPLYIYHLITESSDPRVQQRAWAGALVLMLLVLSLFVVARLISARAGRGRSAPQPMLEEGAA